MPPRPLDLQTDPHFGRRFRSLQRGGWLAYLVVVLLGLSGLTGGGGIWARQESGLAGWPRIMRAGASETLRTASPLRLDPALGNLLTVEHQGLATDGKGRSVHLLLVRPRHAGFARFWLDTGLPAPNDRVHLTLPVLP